MTGKINALFLAILSTCALIALAGCGGGGGGSAASVGPGSGGDVGMTSQAVPTVSGVAAAGAPLVGYVYLRDSSTPATTKGPNRIGPDGSFSFDVTGLTAPFYLQAIGSVGGRGFQLFSVATAPGTANLNPLTNVAVAAAAGTNDPAEVYGGPVRHPINHSNLASAISALRNLLGPLLSAYNADTDFLNGRYAANGTGLDRVFDVTSVTLDTASGMVTITDRATNGTIAQALATNVAGGTFNPADMTQPAAYEQTGRDMTAIEKQAAALMSVLSRGAGVTIADLDPFFANDGVFGVNDGGDRAGAIAAYLAWGAKNIRPGVSVTDTRLSLIEKSGARYTVGVTTVLSDGTVFSTSPDGGDFIFVFDGSAWKIAGNGYYSSIRNDRFRAVSYVFMLPDGPPQTICGLVLNAGDVSNRLNTAVVTGPGLPRTGVILAKPFIPGTTDLVPFLPRPTYRIPGVTGCDTDVYALDDASIAAVPDNAVYTYRFYDLDNNPVETRTITLPKRPLLTAELAPACPALGGLSSHGIASAHSGGVLAFTYAPAAFADFSAVELRGALRFWDNVGDSMELDQILPASGGSWAIRNAAPAWTLTGARLDLAAVDVFRREVHVQWMFLGP